MSKHGGHRPVSLDDYWDIQRITELAHSRRHATAFVVQSVSRERNERCSAVWLFESDPAERVCLSPDDVFDQEPRWSPDGTSLTVASAPTSAKPRRLWLIDARTHERRALTDGAIGASSAAWSPDGRTICFVGDVPVTELDVTGEADWYRAHPAAARATPLRRLTSLRGRVDGRGYRTSREQLFIHDVAGDGPATRLTAGDFDDGDPAWSPDGRSIAFVSNRASDSRIIDERNVYVLEVASGVVRQLTFGQWLFGPLAWSPDGRSIACVGMRGLFLPLALRLWIIAVDGSGTTAASEGFGANLWPMGAPQWTASGRQVIAAGGIGDVGALVAYDRDTSTMSVLLEAEAIFAQVHVLADSESFMAVASTPAAPSLLVRGRLAGGALESLLDINAHWSANVEMARARAVRFPSVDGLAISGWLITPPASEPPYPCVVDVHYGPNAAWGPAFVFGAQAAAARGIATLLLNPRGSTGYGDDFAAAADFGGKDFADLLGGLDALIADGLIDADRLGIMGISYGGFMASWAITQTSRFRAAVSINGITEWLSWYLISDTGLFFFKQRFGDPFADPVAQDRYWQRSPLAHVENVTTPLLLVQSEYDYRCPIDQGEQLFGALVARGKTVEMLRVPDATHDVMSTAAPLHAYLIHRETIAWFERFWR